MLREELIRARASLDPDAVHDLRVAIRRLRACLEAFPTVFRVKPAKRLRQKLRCIFRLAGAVRDTDIAAELHQDSKKSKRRALAKARRLHAHRLRRRISKKRAGKLLRRVRAIIRRAKKDPRDVSVVAGESLSLSLAQVIEQGREAVAAEAPPPVLHRLRIAVKKMRYRAEVFLLLLGPDASGVLDELSDLQTMLGEIQDCETALGLLADGDEEERAAIESRQAALRCKFFRAWREEIDAPGALERRQRQLSGAEDLSCAATASKSVT